MGLTIGTSLNDKDHQLCIEVKGEVTIPLYTKGTKVCFDTHKPSQDKPNQCPKIVMNSAKPWNPQDVVMGQTETQKEMRFRIQATNSDHVTMRMYEDPVLDETLLDSCGCGAWDLCVVRQTKEVHFNLGQVGYDIPDL